jgi:hypothetical protein
MVLVGWAADIPMTLNFPHFEIILYVMSVVTVSIVLNYHKVNWLEGSLLVTTYVMIAVGFWFENVSQLAPHRFAVQLRYSCFLPLGTIRLLTFDSKHCIIVLSLGGYVWKLTIR